MKCKCCGKTLRNNDEATDHASKCPVINQEPPDNIKRFIEIKERIARIFGELPY